jgi:hypothetical protein
MQWEGRLDRLVVAAYELGFERALRTNLDLPNGVDTFEEHPLTEDEKNIWRRTRKNGYRAGMRRKLERDIIRIHKKIEEGKPLMAEERERLAVYQKERDREKNRIRKRIRYRAAGKSSKPQGSLLLRKLAAKGQTEVVNV